MMKKPKHLIYRYSKQRERLLGVLRSTTLHPTADWLYAKLKKEFPRLSLGTVYRNLAILTDLGLVKKLHHGSTFDRFDANIKPHCHMICESCGRIMDLELQLPPDLHRQATDLAGFVVTYHRFDFFGRCETCVKM